MLVNHSGGKVSKALRKAIEQGEIESINDDINNNNQNGEVTKIAGEPQNDEDLV